MSGSTFGNTLDPKFSFTSEQLFQGMRQPYGGRLHYRSAWRRLSVWFGRLAVSCAEGTSNDRFCTITAEDLFQISLRSGVALDWVVEIAQWAARLCGGVQIIELGNAYGYPQRKLYHLATVSRHAHGTFPTGESHRGMTAERFSRDNNLNTRFGAVPQPAEAQPEIATPVEERQPAPAQPPPETPVEYANSDSYANSYADVANAAAAARESIRATIAKFESELANASVEMVPWYREAIEQLQGNLKALGGTL